MPSLDQPRDTKTRYQSVYARHKKGCPANIGGKCACKPSYFGITYDRATRRPRRTRRFPTVEAAKNARADLAAQLDRGETPAPTRALRLTDARERFVQAARDGRALNKRGRRYKPSACDNLDISIRLHVELVLGRRRLTDIRRGDVQAIVDDLQPRLSGSRIRNVVNSLRALYRWAQERDLAQHDPAQHVRLPAMNPTLSERVATPGEFACLLAALDLADGTAFALAGYGFARLEQIRRLRWRDVDLDVGLVEWGVEWEAAKYEASHRTVPVVPSLLAMLKRLYLEQGRPDGGELVIPPRYKAGTAFVSPGGIFKRARRRWGAAGLEPVTFQGARHSVATWLDAAGVSPKVASVLMGHRVPEWQPGAAAVTLRTYTHALPDDIERARDQLWAYLTESQKREAAG